MSLPRSIDRTDLGSATVTVNTTTETVALVGPSLQTPKDTSFIITLASITFVEGTAATGVTLRIRQGSTISGAQVGQSYTQTTPSAIVTLALTMMVSQQVQATDYVQNCLTVQQTGASGNGTVNGATLLMISF